MDNAANAEDSPSSAEQWHPTACVLCSVNCGLEVRIDGPTITRVRGDKAHPGSQGYTCEKGLRIDHYQNGPHRLTSPLRRRPDGTFEEIDWDTAIAEVAARFHDVIAEHGGDKILFYGGGGQGNHLGGGYGGSTRAALGITLHLERARPGEDRRVLGRRAAVRPLALPHHRRLRARRGRRVLGQEPVAVARLPAGPPDPQGDRQRPDAHADRRRSAAHRVGRPRRHPPAPAAGRRRRSARGDAGRARRGATCSPTRWLAEQRQRARRGRRPSAHDRHRRRRATGPASTRPTCAARPA